MYHIAIKSTGSYQNQDVEITNMNAIYTTNFIDNKFKVIDNKIERIKHIFCKTYNV
jgi:hypothetical protein